LSNRDNIGKHCPVIMGVEMPLGVVSVQQGSRGLDGDDSPNLAKKTGPWGGSSPGRRIRRGSDKRPMYKLGREPDGGEKEVEFHIVGVNIAPHSQSGRYWWGWG